MGIAGFFLWLQRWYGDCIEGIEVPPEVAARIAAIDAAERERRAVAAAAAMGESDVPDSTMMPEDDEEEGGRGRGRGGGGRGGGGRGGGGRGGRGPPPIKMRPASALTRYDNLYLDMNGLIHPCCHDTSPRPEPETEEEMIDRIFEQLEIVVATVRPRKCLVMCVDGVAPRSKMNQQRMRRFRAAEEKIESDALAQEEAARIVAEDGLPCPNVRARWDHNVITPATPFMERVGRAIEWFVMRKLNGDEPHWRDLTVMFSDAHVPGEGEHKIMHFIRALRAEPGYNPNTSHVIYGMDADLICLGLATHEPHVAILRNTLTEEFQPKANEFCYFNLSRFRDRLKADFHNIEDLDFERASDDFVFLCFLVGNDFLPHVPLISIKTQGIESLLDHYVRGFGTHGYLTKGGEARFDRISAFLREFAARQTAKLQRDYRGTQRAKERAKQNMESRVEAAQRRIDELARHVGRDLRRPITTESAAAVGMDVVDAEAARARALQAVSDELLSLRTTIRKERLRLVADREKLSFSYAEEVSAMRDKYYQSKFGWDPARRADFEGRVRRCCAEYLRGMQWVMRYYTKGCPSWAWFYPYHYAPLLHDLADTQAADVDVEMLLGEPLHPYEQLLAVMPRESVAALPEALHAAVLDRSSAFAQFYPEHISVDYSEANFAYQGVIRLPFIDPGLLRRACAAIVHLEPDANAVAFVYTRNAKLARELEFAVASAPPEPSDAALTAIGAARRLGWFTAIPTAVVRRCAIAGRIARRRDEAPLDSAVDCPDAPLRARGGRLFERVERNAARCFCFENDVTGEYKQFLLRGAGATVDDEASPKLAASTGSRRRDRESEQRDRPKAEAEETDRRRGGKARRSQGDDAGAAARQAAQMQRSFDGADHGDDDDDGEVDAKGARGKRRNRRSRY